MSAEPPTGRRGRPPSLTRDDVARAALQEGVANLSMPTVARRLGVGHSTLYRYVHDRDDLLLAAMDLAMREFEWPPTDLAWRELLTAFSDAMWRFLEQHAGMAEASQVVPGLPAQALDIATTYVTRLCEEGLSPRDAAIAVDFTADLTVAAEISVRRMSRLFDTPRGRRSLEELYGGPVPGESRREWLNDKLTIMLDGLASRLGEPVTVSRPDIPASPRETAPAPTRDTIAEAGRRIARRSGLPAVSVHAVAGNLVVPPPSPDPRTELLALAAAGYAVMAADPWSIIALTVDGLAAPAIMPVAERVFAAFRAAGVPDDALGHANRILWGHVYGAVLNQAPPDTFARRVATSVALPPPTGPAVPTLGIEIIVDGLLTHLAR